MLAGHATFTVDGQEVDAPAETLVFIGGTELRRGAVAREAGTTVLAIGARPGEPFRVAAWEQTWEESAQAMRLYREQRYDEAADVLREAIERYPEHAGLHYNLACFESLAGEPVESVVSHLRRAIELYPRFRESAATDDDFNPVRESPEFLSAVAGQPDTDGSGA